MPLCSNIIFLKERGYNIKSKSTRKNVVSALKKVIQYLKLYRQTPENGLAIFCGNVAEEEGGVDIKLYAIEPPKPINISLYRCDQQFVLEPLREMLGKREVYGLIAIDNKEATIGLLDGDRIEVLKKMTSGAHSKHRAGGQSQRRFERIIEQQHHEFKKRVAEAAQYFFLNREDLKGIILGGPGPTKEYFLEEGYLHHELRKKVIGVVNTSYTYDIQALRDLVYNAESLLSEVEAMREKEVMQRFLKELIKDDGGLALYGKKEVMTALRSGAVDVLLISDEIDTAEIKVTCPKCGYVFRMTEKKFENSDELVCKKCGNKDLELEKVDIIDEITKISEEFGTEVIFVSTDTEEGAQLYNAFGGMAAILRYKVN